LHDAILSLEAIGRSSKVEITSPGRPIPVRITSISTRGIGVNARWTWVRGSRHVMITAGERIRPATFFYNSRVDPVIPGSARESTLATITA